MRIVLDEAYRPGVRTRFDGHDVSYFPSSVQDAASLKPFLDGAEVIGFRRVLPFAFDPVLVADAPGLQFIHRSGSGADWFDLDHLSELGVLVAVNSGFNSPSVAEHTVLMTLLCLRRSLDFIDSMRGGQWLRDLPGDDPMMLSGKTVGVLGYGAIGSKVTRAMLGLNARVLVHQRDPAPDLPEGAELVGFDDVVTRSDVISLHVPLMPETRHLLHAAEFARMKSGVVIINTSRGETVDNAALLDALRNGHVRAAGLDVFEEEPLPEDHPFRSMPNVVTTPHVGGSGVEVVHMQVEGTLANIDLFVAGQSPERLVNPQILQDGRARASHLATG